jgi:hypothetical protein
VPGKFLVEKVGQLIQELPTRHSEDLYKSSCRPLHSEYNARLLLQMMCFMRLPVGVHRLLAAWILGMFSSL